MAYDPNDAADVAIVDGLIEEATKGLKANNTKLLDEKKALQKQIRDGGNDPKAVERLEAELERVNGELETAQTTLKKTTKDFGKATKDLEAETAYNRNLLVENGLTDAFTKAKVAPQFMTAVKALFAGKVEIKTEGSERKAFIGDKPLVEAVTAWSQSDEGKHYVAAANNRGGGANPGGGAGQGKTITRTALEAMPHSERPAFFADGGKVTDG